MTTRPPSQQGRVSVPTGYVVGHRARPQAEPETAGIARDWIAPVLLLAVGVIGRIIEVATAHNPSGLPTTAAVAIIGLVVAAVAIAVGLVITAQVMGSELEPPAVLARKVLALAAIAIATAALVAGFDKDPEQMRGAVAALHVILLAYFIGLTWLMKMDLLEGLMAAVIALAAQAAVYLAVAQALPHGLGRVLFFGS